jgi:hypothetical protein
MDGSCGMRELGLWHMHRLVRTLEGFAARAARHLEAKGPHNLNAWLHTTASTMSTNLTLLDCPLDTAVACVDVERNGHVRTC